MYKMSSHSVYSVQSIETVTTDYFLLPCWHSEDPQIPPNGLAVQAITTTRQRQGRQRQRCPDSDSDLRLRTVRTAASTIADASRRYLVHRITRLVQMLGLRLSGHRRQVWPTRRKGRPRRRQHATRRPRRQARLQPCRGRRRRVRPLGRLESLYYMVRHPLSSACSPS
jgi:hypothetical protein